MKLHEIIKTNEDPKDAVLIEKMIPYKKSLLIYYSNLFTSEPLLMVTMVSNAVQYAKIVPLAEFSEAICEYLDDYDCMNENSDNFSEYETINFNSIMLKDL